MFRIPFLRRFIRTTYYVLRTSSGLTLLELLIFVGIFSMIIIAFMAVFTTISVINLRSSSATEVASQTQFLLQTIQYYVGQSSAVDITADTATTTLKLRMQNSAIDPTIISLSGSTVTLQQGGGQVKNLTSGKVNVTSLQFTRRTNPPGHDSVAVAFVVEYNTSNLKQQFVQSFNSAVSRAAAATFDSNILPTTGGLDVGITATPWRSINNTIYFNGSNVGIGNSSAAQTLQVTGGNIYIDTATNGLILKAPNGTSCYLITVTNGGGIATSSIAC